MSKNFSRNSFIIMGVLLAFGIAISLYARWYSFFPGDLHLILFVQSFNSALLRSVMQWASLLFGDWPAALLVIVTGILVWWRLGRLEGILIPVAGLISLINYTFKIAINRPRPSPDMVRVLISEQGKTFPSGHAFFATIFLGILAYLLFIHLKRRSLRIFSLVIFVMLILLVGTSRIYLGAHWPSDVIGGYIVGGLFLALLIWGYEWWKTRLKARGAKQ